MPVKKKYEERCQKTGTECNAAFKCCWKLHVKASNATFELQ